MISLFKIQEGSRFTVEGGEITASVKYEIDFIKSVISIKNFF
jgi:hypothetical protein